MDKNQLQEHIESGLSSTEIAKIYNKSRSTIVYWLKKYKLATKSKYFLDNKKISDDDIKTTWNVSSSMSDFLKNLGVNLTGGAWYHYKRRLDNLGIDITVGAKHRAGLITAKITNSQNIKNYKRLRRSSLMKALDLSEREYICSECGCNDWRGKYIKLQIHHKDHNKNNNKLDNLEYLCPNCHSQKHFSK